MPGLFFLGLLWQHSQASASLLGPTLDGPYLLDAMSRDGPAGATSRPEPSTRRGASSSRWTPTLSQARAPPGRSERPGPRVAQPARQAAPAEPGSAIATTSASISPSRAPAGLDPHARLVVAGVRERMDHAGSDLDDVARAGQPAAQAEPEPIGPSTIEALRWIGARAGWARRRRAAGRARRPESPSVVADVCVKVNRSPVTGFSSVAPGLIMRPSEPHVMWTL